MSAASKSSPIVLKAVFWSLCCCVVLISFLSTLHKTGMVNLPGSKPNAYIPVYFPGKFALQAILEDDSNDNGPSISTVYVDRDLENVRTNRTLRIISPVRVQNNVTGQGNKKVTHIGLLKVHKASSTTMQNMLFRFGLKNGLTIVTPKHGHYYMSEKIPTVKPRNFTHYDIFACHTVYRKSFYDKLLPADAVRIGIVREPFDRMMSAAYYYRDVQKLSYLKKVPVHRFIHNLINGANKYDKGPFSRTRNSMGKDFGFSPTRTMNQTSSINAYLKRLGRDFKLVLITEHFEESLVLMKRLLHWSFTDIIYLTSNAHVHKETDLTPEEWTKFKEANFLDVAIYNYFNGVFKKKMKKGGEDLKNEVKYFKNILVKVKTFCDSNPKHEDKLLLERSRWDGESEITGVECFMMKYKELPFFAKLRNIHSSGKPISYDSFLE